MGLVTKGVLRLSSHAVPAVGFHSCGHCENLVDMARVFSSMASYSVSNIGPAG
jgi:hypothetical protein